MDLGFAPPLFGYLDCVDCFANVAPRVVELLKLRINQYRPFLTRDDEQTVLSLDEFLTLAYVPLERCASRNVVRPMCYIVVSDVSWIGNINLG